MSHPASILSLAGWTNEFIYMEGRNGESVVDALGSMGAKTPAGAPEMPGRVLSLCLSVCPAASLLGYLYSPWEHLSFESPFSRSKWICMRSLGSWRVRVEVWGSAPGAGHEEGCDACRCPVLVVVCRVSGMGYWGAEAVMGKWAFSSPGMLRRPQYCQSHGSIRSGTCSQCCSLVIPM